MPTVLYICLSACFYDEGIINRWESGRQLREPVSRWRQLLPMFSLSDCYIFIFIVVDR